jgi:aminoglycoside 3-N-acetyltransferase
MVQDLNLEDCFRKLGIAPSDTIMLHGDAGPLAQLRHFPANERSQRFVENVAAYFMSGGGTVVVPTFSYSFTKNEVFNVQTTPSNVGSFSEIFRTHPGWRRSLNPNFSVVTRGRNEDAFANSSFRDSFGKGTAFDLLYELDAKIVCFGCSFNRVTFLHYLEQMHGVSYRYFKKFPGTIVNGDQQIKAVARYYVRDLGIETTCDLDDLYRISIEQGALKEAVFGRFPVASIRAKAFFSNGLAMLEADEYALIRERHNRHALKKNG